MTILAIGASVTLNIANDGSCKISTNGGLASVSVTPIGGVTSVFGVGPLPVRQTFGPFAAGAVVVVSNQTASLDYAVQSSYDSTNVAVTGGSIGGRSIQRSISGQGVRRWGGIYVGQTAFAGYTWRLKMELPIPAANLRSFRFAVASHTVSDVPIMSAVSTSSTFAALNPSASWQFAGFDGSSHQAFQSFTIKQKQQLQSDEIWSDWITSAPTARTDSGTFAVIHISVYGTSANITTAGNNTSDAPFSAVAAPDLKYSTHFQAGDFTTTAQNTFAGSSAPACSPIIAVEWLGDDGISVHSIAHYTDSIGMAFGTSIVGKGPIIDACTSINSTGVFRVSPAMSCVPGEMVEATYRRFEQACKLGKGLPSVAVFRPYTRNNGGNTTKAFPYMLAFINECRARGIVPVLETGIYDAATTSNNAGMLVVNAFVRSYASANGIGVVELEDLFNAGNAATFLGDGIHPNDAGQALMVPRFVSAINVAIQKISLVR